MKIPKLLQRILNNCSIKELAGFFPNIKEIQLPDPSFVG
jgi:hypothetical protein